MEGTCASGYYVEAGKPYRGCDITGTFTAVQNPCQRTAAHRGGYMHDSCTNNSHKRFLLSDFLPPTAIKCPAIAAEANAAWPESNAGDEVEGTCLPGYEGTIVRSCTGTTTSPGTWGSIDGSCERACTGCWAKLGRSMH